MSSDDKRTDQEPNGLSDAARAHEDIISRKTQGKLLLDPSA